MWKVVIVAAVLGTGWLSLGQAGAERPETPALATPATMKISVPLGLQLGLPYIAWDPVDGAVGYRLSGELHMLRVNREDPFCTAPVEQDSQTLGLGDEEPVSAKVDHVDLPVPKLPPEDAWFFFDVRVEIQALDDGNVIAAGRAVGIAETLRDCPTVTPEILLPRTGARGGGAAGLALSVTVAVAFLAAGGTVLAALLVRWRYAP